MTQTKTDTHELEKAVREAAAHEDQEIAGIPGFITDEEQETADLPDERPYEELGESLRIEEEREDRELLAIVQRIDAEDDIDLSLLDAEEDEEAVYHALLRLADRRGDDHAEVFAILYGDGSVLSPSEALLSEESARIRAFERA